MKNTRPNRFFLMITLIACVTPFIAVGADADSPAGLTPGSVFTVTITGIPRTPYYVWLTRTSSMSGEPGDQPPVISGGIADVEKDPAGGPYVIGRHTISSGGTIIDDVAPSPEGLPGTDYYALVTTGSDGVGVVRFRIGPDTKARTYSVKVEDRGGGSGNFDVQVNLFPRTAPLTPTLTTIPTADMPAATTPTAEPSVPTAVPTTPATPPPPSRGPEASPTKSSPIPPWVALSAVAVVLLLASRR